MADIKTLEDVQKNFEEISEMLTSLSFQSTQNMTKTNNALQSLDIKLSDLDNSENTDLIKVFLAELKKGLEEKHDFMTSKFSQFESELGELAKQTGEKLNPSEIRELFDIIATNLSVFSKEVMVQKETLGDIILQIDAARQDDTKKKEVIKNISLVKADIDKVNNAFAALTVTLDEEFKDVLTRLETLDFADNFKNLKKDIENIFLSSNAVLSSLQVIDHKNKEIDGVLRNLVTKEDFEKSNNKVDELISKNSELTAKVETLSTNDEMENLSKNVDTAIGVIEALREVLIKSGEDGQSVLLKHLDTLDETVKGILSQDDFLRFKDDLTALVSEVVQSSNLTRTDLLDLSFELKNLNLILSSIDIKNNFSSVISVIEEAKKNVTTSVLDISKKINEETGKKSFEIKEEISNSVDVVSEKIAQIEETLKENSSENLNKILVDIQEIMTFLSSYKSEAHLESIQEINAIDSNFQLLKDEFLSHRETLLNNSAENVEKIEKKIADISVYVDVLRRDIASKADENFNNLSLQIGQISSVLDHAKGDLKENSAINLKEILSSIKDVVSNIETLKEGFNSDLVAQVIDIKDSIYTIPLIIKENQNTFEEEKRVLIEENSKVLEGLTSKIEKLIQGFNVKDNTVKDKIIEEITVLKTFIDEVKVALIGSDFEVFEGLKTNLSIIETSINKSFDGQEKSINSLKEDLGNQLLQIKTENEISGEKIEEFSEKISDVKSEITSVIELVNANKLTEDGKSEVLFTKIGDNFETVLNKITEAQKFLEEKSQENSQRALASVEAQFNSILSQIEDYKVLTSNQSDDVKDSVSDLTERIIEIKSDVEKIDVGLINVFTSKIQLVLDALTPLKEVLNTVVNFDVEKIAVDIKTQIDLSHALLNESLREKGNDNKEEIISAVSEKIDDFEVKFASVRQLFEQSKKEENELLKENLSALISNFEQLVSTLKPTVEESNKPLMEELLKLEEALNLGVNIKSDDIKTELDIIANRLEERISIGNDDNSNILKDFGVNFDGKILSLVNRIDENISQLKDMEDHLNNGFSKGFGDIRASLISKEYFEVEIDNLKDVIRNVEDGVNNINFSSQRDEIIGQINYSEGKILENMDKKFEDLSEKTLNNELLQDKIDEIKNSLSNINVEVDLETPKEEILKKLDVLNQEIKVFGEESNNDILEKFTTLEEIVTTSSQSSKNLVQVFVNDVKESLLEKFGEFEEKVSLNSQENKNSLEDFVGEFKGSLLNKMGENFEGLKVCFEELEAKKIDYNPILEEFKQDMHSQFDKIETGLSQEIAMISKMSDLDKIYGDITDTIRNLFANLYENISAKISENTLSEQIIEQNDKLAKTFDEMKKGIIEDVFVKFEEFSIDFGKQKEVFDELKINVENALSDLRNSLLDLSSSSNNTISTALNKFDEKMELLKIAIEETGDIVSFDKEKEQIISEIAALKENYIELSLNSSMEISNALNEIKEKIENLEEKVIDIDFGEEFSTITGLAKQMPTQEVLDEKFVALNRRIDIFAEEMAVQVDMSEEFSQLKEILASQSDLINQFSHLDDLAKLEKLDELGKLDFFESEIKDIFTKISQKVDDLSSEQKGNLETILTKAKEEILCGLISITEQVSLTDDIEEIKKLLNKETGFIREEIKNIESKVENTNYDVGENLKDLKKQIKLMQTSTDSDADYLYTMQDLESDLAKVRLDLKQLAVVEPDKNVEELVEKFNTLQNSLMISQPVDLRAELNRIKDSILSVSERTNQVLLNSDEIQMSVRDNFDDFRTILSNFDIKLNKKNFGGKAQLPEFTGVASADTAKMEEKLNHINEMLLSSMKSDKVLHQAFMYLAEWIDSTSENMKKIQEKFEVQQEKMQVLEEKMEKVCTKADLEEMFEKLSGSNVDKMSKKVDNIEKQLAKLTKNIDKIASYVDE